MLQRLTILSTLLISIFASATNVAYAQTYPSQPIKMVVAFPAGGTTDLLARVFARKMSELLNQPVTVENRTGAGGIIGTEYVARAAPDGQVIMLGTVGTMSVNQSLYKKLPYDVEKDFVPITLLATLPNILLTNPSLPFKNTKELIAYAKANPGKFTFGSTGNGTTPHLAVEEFAMKAGIQLQHVPFKGSADGMASVLGGHVMAHSDATGWAPLVDAGTCRLLATYGSKRTKRWANVPTLNELGYDTVSDSPFGIGGPKGMDPAITRKLQDTFKKTLEDPQVLAIFDKFDQSVIYMGTEEYTQYARDNFQKEKAIIDKLGLAKPA